MSVKNCYPELPELQYHRSQVEIPTVIVLLRALDIPLNVKRAAYVFFRIESRNGQSGICNNYAGFQADCVRWDAEFDPLIEGTCVLKDSGGDMRRFLCFYSVDGFLKMLTQKLKSRGLYVGGNPQKYAKMVVMNETDLCRAYEKEWVKGNPKAEPSKEKLINFLSMYSQAKAIFN
jgi:hypothetical protein